MSVNSDAQARVEKILALHEAGYRVLPAFDPYGMYWRITWPTGNIGGIFPDPNEAWTYLVDVESV